MREERTLTAIDAAMRLEGGIVRGGETALSLMPPESALGLVFAYLAPLLVGASLRHFERRPTPPELRRELASHPPQVLFAGAEMVRALARDPGLSREHVDSIRAVVCSGSRLEPGIIERLRDRHGLHVCTWYGSAETLLVSANRSEDNRSETVGRPVMGVSVRILGDDGSALEPGDEGEIAVAGPTVLSRHDGYFGEDAPAPDFENEWLRTGDIGSVDADGYVRFAGRRKAIAKVDGASVDLLEVRRVLLSIPGVDNVRLDVRADEVHGQRVDATLTMSEPAAPSSLLAIAREQLASHKVPHSMSTQGSRPDGPRTRRSEAREARGSESCSGPESTV